MTADQATQRQASAANCNAELLRELRHAHQIIRNALNIMTPAQKEKWAKRNDRDGVTGEGTTRFFERESAIKRAIDTESRP